MKKWTEFKDINVRNKLIEENINLANSIATKFFHKYHRKIPLGDLKSHSYIGLIDAVEKFDYSQGFEFSTYASKRIYGAIIDSLRNEGNIYRMKDKEGNPKYTVESIETFYSNNEDVSNTLLYKVTEEDPIWNEFEKNYIQDVVEKLLSTVQEKERKIIVYYYFEHKSDSQIAKLLNVSHTTIHNLRNKILFDLRRKIYLIHKLTWKDIAA